MAKIDAKVLIRHSRSKLIYEYEYVASVCHVLAF